MEMPPDPTLGSWVTNLQALNRTPADLECMAMDNLLLQLYEMQVVGFQDQCRRSLALPGF